MEIVYEGDQWPAGDYMAKAIDEVLPMIDQNAVRGAPRKKVLVEILVSDFHQWTACVYMAQAVRALPESIQQIMELREWDMRTLDGIRRFSEFKCRSLPSIAIENELVFQSIIPTEEEFIWEIIARFTAAKWLRIEGEAMKIEVLGTGCQRCEDLYANAVSAASKLEFPIQVTKVADPGYFIKMGVFVTPGLVIDGEVISTGKLLTIEEITNNIRKLV